MAKRGRGLGSLLGTGPAPGATRDDSPLEMAPVDQIRPNPLQPRRDFDEEALKTLAQSLKSNGLLQPVRHGPDNSWQPERPG